MAVDLHFVSAETVIDHETRIRSIERWRGRVEGAIAAALFMSGTAISVTGVVLLAMQRARG